MTMTISADVPAAVRDAIDAACERIAPTWPLDRFIAVNPYWGWRRSPIGEAAARLGAFAGTTLTMPRAWFREEWNAGRLADHHLGAAASALEDPGLVAAAHALLEHGREPEAAAVHRLPLVTDIVDSVPGSAPGPGRTWSDLVTHQIGQHCAAHFDEWQANWSPAHEHDLFGTWRADPAVIHGFRWRRSNSMVRAQLDSLPDSAAGSIAVMVRDLGLDDGACEAYFTAVLASVNGWAAWCAYRRWQARLDASDDATIVDLLTIRLAWEWLLAADSDDTAATLASLAAAWSGTDDAADANRDAQRLDWVLQAAAERTYQDTVISGLGRAKPPADSPDVQALFCIDVRSEVFRRALEGTAASAQTRGFAGFFGLPIEYTPAGSALTRPQLPGLLAPVLGVTDVMLDQQGQAMTVDRSVVLAERRRWDAFRRQPSSVFSFVETLGLTYGLKLVTASVPHAHPPAKWELDGIGRAHADLRPRLDLIDDDPAAAAALALRVLTAMGVLDAVAPLVMLCGHASLTTNNAHAAGLDCGACGGQTGEVNARALADLLNDPIVRRELSALGVDLPTSTWFVAALHNTTTDDVELFDTDLAPESHRERVDELGEWLRAAGGMARAERAASLGLGHLVSSPARLKRRVMERANDWSQVRPEWGLVDNAAFIVAPRWRTRHLDLHGRCFLHDYDWRRDEDHAVLTLIMTAPMVVTNWINLQYHASTVDNRRYGCGNKVLHNVVGGNIGVFEGNGGDLRIGLPIQSLHDGHTLRHHPLRLSVFIEAPRTAIDAVIDAQPIVQDLVLNGWLNLLRIESCDGAVEERTGAGWHPRPAAPSRASTRR